MCHVVGHKSQLELAVSSMDQAQPLPTEAALQRPRCQRLEMDTQIKLKILAVNYILRNL